MFSFLDKNVPFYPTAAIHGTNHGIRILEFAIPT